MRRGIKKFKWFERLYGKAPKQASNKQQASYDNHDARQFRRVQSHGHGHKRWRHTHTRWLDETSKIPTVLNELFARENISSKDQLDYWCGHEKRAKLYNHVKYIASEHWNKLKVPESSVRYHYEMVLTGFKISRV
jgi:hypothetical protein